MFAPPEVDSSVKVARSVRTHDMGDMGMQQSSAIGFAQSGLSALSVGGSSAANGRGCALGPFEGPRVIVFVAGGITWSEVKCLHRIMKQMKREIVIGA